MRTMRKNNATPRFQIKQTKTVPSIPTSCGFTLIEMMLIITLIAILAALSINTYRQHEQNTKIIRTSLEMQAIAQAALAYANIENAWPPSDVDNNTSEAGALNCNPLLIPDPNMSEFTVHYLPNQNFASPFGSTYCWAPNLHGDVHQSPLFWIALPMPFKQITLAKRVAAYLPNAVLTDDPLNANANPPCVAEEPCYIKMAIPMDIDHNSHGMTIAAIGDCRAGVTMAGAGCSDTAQGNIDAQTYRIAFKACPAGTQPAALLTPNYYITSSTTPMQPILQTLIAPGQNASCTNNPDENGLEFCNVAVTATYCGNDDKKCKVLNIKHLGGNIGASYVIACKPKTITDNQPATIKSTNLSHYL